MVEYLGGGEGGSSIIRYRQGCTLSTELFRIVTFEIIKELEVRGQRFIVEDIDLTSLFFADDTVLLADSEEKAQHNLQIVTEIGK